MDALVEMIGDIESGQKGGALEGDLTRARGLQRRAQFYLDFVEGENSTGFHAPEEAGRILAESIDFSAGPNSRCASSSRAGAKP